ncbi:serine hydrolase [Sporosarcina sp. FA9]|uniref:serine hydrolase n=1 Tax=Sporosarcina sp. FA9 TaxID=3413030 RepID=UPI003F6586C9
MKELTQKIEEHIGNADGKWAIVLEDMDREEVWAVNQEELFYAASIIKLPIMAAAFDLAEQGKLTLSKQIELKRENQVGGAGVLQHLTPGTELTIYDLLTLMIIQSDNTATNILIDIVGVKQIQQMMKVLGMRKSEFYNKVMTVPTKIIGRNMITAVDISGLLKKFATGQSTSLHSCQQMIDIMKKQQLQNGFSAHLPKHSSDIVGQKPEWELASKSGSVTGIQHDAGIFYVGNRTMTLTVLSRECDGRLAQSTLAKIGLDVYKYMNNGIG